MELVTNGRNRPRPEQEVMGGVGRGEWGVRAGGLEREREIQLLETGIRTRKLVPPRQDR